MIGVTRKLFKHLKRTSDAEVTAIRLCTSNFASLPSSMVLPQYNRSDIRPGIVHLGLRDFHRVHSAVFIDDVLNTSKSKQLGIVSVAMNETHRKPFRMLKEQDGMYTTIERGHDSDKVRVIGSVLDVLFAPEQPEKVVDVIAGSNILTLTLKENNYCLLDDFTALNLHDPRIHRDLQAQTPKTAVGLIAAALEKRFARKETKPLVVISCDNLNRGGDLTKMMVTQFLANKRATFRIPPEWVEHNVSFPNSVSDRICHTDNADNFQALMDMGVRDEGLLTTEKFRSWVIEDVKDLPSEFRDIEGLKIVKDSKAHENVKTRLNYGMRVSLAIVGQQQDHEVFETILADPLLKRFTQKYIEEVKFGLGKIPEHFDIDAFGNHVIERISTPGLKYQVKRLTEDVSRKCKMEWLPVIHKLSAADRSSETLAFSLASWTALLAGRVGSLAVVDCNADILRPMAVRAVNGDPRWFLNAIADHKPLGTRFVEDYRASLRAILLKGPRGAMQDLMD